MRNEWGRNSIAVAVAGGLAAGLILSAAWVGINAMFVVPSRSSAEIHFAPEEDLEAIDVSLIGQARSSVDIAAYVLTDKGIAEALAAAGRRGARVRVWQDAEEAEQTGAYDIAKRLGDDHPGLEIRYKEPGPLMHLKGYCVDGAVFRTGSANFSRSGLHEQDNDLVVLRGPQACAGFEAKFGKLWGAQ